jgi:predicted transcriptional regulator
MTYVMLKYVSIQYNCSHGDLFMVTPCEIAVKSLIPSIRAYIAKELTQTHKMRQEDAARLLGITQTAISKYVRDVRGQVIKVHQTPEIREMMYGIASRVADQKISGPELTLEFCAVCKTVRRNGLMCSLCQRNDPSLDARHCNVCKNDLDCSVT